MHDEPKEIDFALSEHRHYRHLSESLADPVLRHALAETFQLDIITIGWMAPQV